MSQWGAYAMAADGSSAQQIIEHYFAGITTEKLW
jgi:stage II sporulation protein D